MKDKVVDKPAILGGSPVRSKPFYQNACIGTEERQLVNAVLDSGLLSGFIAQGGDAFYGGPMVRRLEEDFRKYFTVPYAVAMNSATACLHAALAACGIEPQDEVIVPPYTMCATATSVIMNQAVPVFADIEDRTYGLDPADVKRKITARTRALVIVHLFGHPARLDDLLDIARRYHLCVIEDCAQAIGATYKGYYVGTFGDVGVFSLNQHKTITSGEGGVAITKNSDLATRMQLIRNHAEAVVEALKVEDIGNLVGFNYRMTELEAAVAVGQFQKLEAWNQHRIKLADYLTQKLSKYPELELPLPEPECHHVYFVYPVRYRPSENGCHRNQLVQALRAEGIPVAAGYVKPLYHLPLYRQKIAYGTRGWPFPKDYTIEDCPTAERLYNEELLMTPVCRYPHTNDDIEDVVAAFEKIWPHLENLKNLCL